MKRFFYGLLATSLLIAGCGKEEGESTKVHEVEMYEADAIAREEALAMEELRKFLEEEGDNLAALDSDEFISDEALEAELKMLEEQFAQELAWAEEEANRFPALQFEEKSKKLNPEDLSEELERTIENAKAVIAEGGDITICGHAAQNEGDANLTLALSEDRAREVQSQLVEAGIPAERTHVIGYADAEPRAWTTATADNEAALALAENRRVEIFAS